MTSLDPPECEQVAALVCAAMHELLETMHSLCGRLQASSDPLGQDDYDRLGMLFPVMLNAADEMCRAADRLCLGAIPLAIGGEASPTPYAELAQTLAKARPLVVSALRTLRPNVQEHSDAIALIARLSKESVPLKAAPRSSSA